MASTETTSAVLDALATNLGATAAEVAAAAGLGAPSRPRPSPTRRGRWATPRAPPGLGRSCAVRHRATAIHRGLLMDAATGQAEPAHCNRHATPLHRVTGEGARVWRTGVGCRNTGATGCGHLRWRCVPASPTWPPWGATDTQRSRPWTTPRPHPSTRWRPPSSHWCSRPARSPWMAAGSPGPCPAAPFPWTSCGASSCTPRRPGRPGTPPCRGGSTGAGRRTRMAGGPGWSPSSRAAAHRREPGPGLPRRSGRRRRRGPGRPP